MPRGGRAAAVSKDGAARAVPWFETAAEFTLGPRVARTRGRLLTMRPRASRLPITARTCSIGRVPPPPSRPMNVVKGILFKLASALMFAVMSALVRWLGEAVPVGQIVFFRSVFAVLAVVIIYAMTGELAAALRTGRPLGHVGRGFLGVAGMFLSFAALARLPLAEATAISFAGPFITVALAALLLKERVRI